MNNQKKAINELLGSGWKWFVGFGAVLLIVMIPAWYGMFLSYLKHDEGIENVIVVLVMFDIIKPGMLGFKTSLISTSFRTNMPAISLLPNKTGDTVSYLRRKLDMSVLMPLAYEIFMLFFMLVKQGSGGFSGTVIDSPVKIAAYIFITAAAYGFYLCITAFEPTESMKTTKVAKTLLLVFAVVLAAMGAFIAKTAAQLLLLDSAQPVLWLAASAVIAAAVWGYYLIVGRKKFMKNYLE